MASEIGTWVYGNEAGPGSKFIACACVTKVQENNGKYDVTVQYKVRVKAQTDGFGSTIATASWMSEKFTMAGKNSTFDVEATITNKVYKNQVGGTVLSLPFSAQYSTTSTTYKSSATLEYLVPNSVYTITYKPNADNVTSMPESQTKKHNEDVILSSTRPQREGYSLYEWNTSADMGGICYLPEEVYSDNANLTLYAIWNEKSYKIKYYGNGGSNCPTEQTKYYFSDKPLSTQEPTRPGYKFLGWSTESDLSSNKVTYNPGDTYTVNEDINLYALWEAQNVAYYKVGGKYVLCNTYGKVNGKWEPRLMYIKINGVYVRTGSNDSEGTGGSGSSAVFQSFVSVEPTDIQVYVGTTESELRNTIQVYALYSDGVTREFSNYTFVNYKVIEEGKNAVKIQYQNQTFEFNVQGMKKDDNTSNILGISASISKSEFTIGTTIDEVVENLSVRINYSDGTPSELITGYTVFSNKGDSVVDGENILNIQYVKDNQTYETTLSIYGIAKETPDPDVTFKLIDSVNYPTSPIPVGTTESELREMITVYGLYSDGNVYEITDYDLLSYSPIVAGENNITIGYESDTYSIKVFGESGTIEPEIVFESFDRVEPSTIEVPSGMTQDEFRKVITVYGLYSDGNVYEITDYSFTSSYNIADGDNIVPIQYENKILRLNVYGIPKDVTLESISAKYIGEDILVGTSVSSLSKSSFYVVAHYSDLSEMEIKDDFTISGGTNGKIISGNNFVTITYNQKTVQCVIYGFDNVISGIQRGTISNLNIDWGKNDISNKSISYSDSVEIIETTAQLVDPLTVSFNKNDSWNDYDVLLGKYIQYGATLYYVNANSNYEYKKNVNALVIARISYYSVQEITLTAERQKVQNLEAEYLGEDLMVGTPLTNLDPEDISVIATYGDGTRQEVTSYTLSGSISNVGENTITVTYKDRKTTFKIYGFADASGLTMVTGTITNSTTINTGLSSIEQFVIYRDSVSSVGLVNGSYNASLGIATANITSADSLLKSGDVGYVHNGIIVNGGTVTWNPSSDSSGQLASGVTYNWIAVGEK